MRLVYVILLIIWLALGYYWFSNKYQNNTISFKPNTQAESVQSNIDCKPNLHFVDNSHKLLVKSKSNFKFQRSTYNHLEIDTSFQSQLVKVAEFLSENPEVKMQIKGMYDETEENKSNYENIGLARASNVKTYFLTLGTNSSQILTTSKLLVTDCFDKDSILTKGVVVAFGN